jgi:rhomboid protease GluP
MSDTEVSEDRAGRDSLRPGEGGAAAPAGGDGAPEEADSEGEGEGEGEEGGAPRQGLFNPLPALVVVVALALAAIEAVFLLAQMGFVGGADAIGWRMQASMDWGFSAPLFDQMVARHEFPPRDLARFLSYGLIHASPVHALFAVVLLLALGKAVSASFSTAAVAATLLAGLVAGALGYWALLDGRHLLVGAYPAIYALLGAFTWGLWRQASGRGRVLAFRLVGVLIALQVAFRLVEDTGDIWVAEAAGFAAGFGLAFLVAPGGGERLRQARARLRAR